MEVDNGNDGKIIENNHSLKEFACSKCSLKFLTKSERDRHGAKVHKSSFLLTTGPESKIEIHRNATTGLFECCSPGCSGKGFERSDALARHYANIHWPGSSSGKGSKMKSQSTKRPSSFLEQPQQTPIILPFIIEDTPELIRPTGIPSDMRAHIRVNRVNPRLTGGYSLRISG